MQERDHVSFLPGNIFPVKRCRQIYSRLHGWRGESMTWSEWLKIAIGARAVRLRSGQGRGVAGVSAPALSRYERGSRRPAQEVTVRAWARGLGLDEEQAVAAWRAA